MWLAGGTAAIAITSAWFALRPRRGELALANHSSALTARTSSEAAGTLLVLDADALIEQLGLQGEIHLIAELIGISRVNFNKDVLPTIRAVVEFSQLLPASQSHHHANPGGLAQHVIDVARRALAIRGGRELPVGCSPEDRARRKHRWSVGVFLVALLHDIGKPITDVIVQFSDLSSTDLRRWQPLTGSMRDMGLKTYSVVFPGSGEREYRAHEKLGIVLLQRCAPAHVLSWLGEDAELMQSMFALLSGDHEKAGVLAEIVRQADMESTAHNLRHGSRVRFSAAKQTPLIEVLMQRLRHLLSHVDGVSIPLNASGAGGFVGADFTWLVVPRVVDLLIEDIKRVEPNRSLPSDRTRIFDTFQEFGAIEARPGTTQCVWKIRVRGGNAETGTDFVHELSALKFSTSLLFKAAPKQFEGRIEVVGEATTASSTNTAPALVAPTAMASATITGAQPLAPLSNMDQSSIAQKQPTSSVQSVTVPPSQTDQIAQAAAPIDQPLPMEVEVQGLPLAQANPLSSLKEKKKLPSPGAREVMLSASPSIVEQVSVTSAVAAQAIVTEVTSNNTSASAMLDSLLGNMTENTTSIGSAAAPQVIDKRQLHLVLPPVVEDFASVNRPPETEQSMPAATASHSAMAPLPPVVVPHPAKLAESHGMGPLASGFIRWLQEGLAQQTIECNGSNAFFHTLDEGVGLVSPRAFQVFAASLTKELQPGHKLPKELSQTVIAHVSKIQSELKKAKVVRQNGDKVRPDYFHAYVIASSQKRINMMLIDEPAAYFSSLPPPNRLLSRAQLQSIA
ncbi:MAG: hypothetical protein EAZ30_02945 [Betaproteobacteria bacterium]|nr:MAG: hypothetical protein EAZ30_02945 [Betaproteobacteria bacterium]